jgi:hypothetical protein
MLVLFGIRMFKLYKYVENMSLISLILQHISQGQIEILILYCYNKCIAIN